MKAIIRFLFLIVAILSSSCENVNGENNVSSRTLYGSYKITVPTDNYVILSMRAFGPNNYLVLDMNANDLRIYSPCQGKGFLFQRKLTMQEIILILAIFESDEYMEVPEMNMKVALDAEEIDVTSIVKKRKKHIHHIMSDHKVIKRIENLYRALNKVPR